MLKLDGTILSMNSQCKRWFFGPGMECEAPTCSGFHLLNSIFAEEGDDGELLADMLGTVNQGGVWRRSIRVHQPAKAATLAPVEPDHHQDERTSSDNGLPTIISETNIPSEQRAVAGMKNVG